MEWSSNLAYAVGLMATDGNLSKDGRHLDFTSKDLQLIKTFLSILNLKNKIGLKKSSYNRNGIYYRVQFGNVKFYKFLLGIKLTPNKTKTIGELKIPDRYFVDFLRGHLDGDGCTYSFWDKRWKSSFRFYTELISASLTHVEWLQNSIHRLYGIKGNIRAKRSVFCLEYAKSDSVLLLKKIYYKKNLPCLLRKRSKIEAALGIISKRADVL